MKFTGTQKKREIDEFFVEKFVLPQNCIPQLGGENSCELFLGI